MTTSVQSVPPETYAALAGSSIGSLLLESGKLTAEDAERIVRLQRTEGVRFGEAAKMLGLISDTDIEQVLARQFDYPYITGAESPFPRELVAAYQPFSPQVEVLRAIRSQLILRWFAKGRRSLLFASAQPGDGVSLGIANLAVVFSQLGERTLLVDANLRNPGQHTIFNLGGGAGLSDILARRAGPEVITKVEPFVDLSVLPAGTQAPNPQELLSRHTFSTLAESLSVRYDAILIDASAFSLGADVLSLAAHVGGIVLVARRNHSNMEEMQAIAHALEGVSCELVGAVMFDF
jgi:protein-tyrosine kinase